MSTTTTTNYGWVIPNDSELVKDGAAAIRTLGNSADASLKTVSDAAVTKSTFTTKGDLLTTTGASTIARLGVGTDGQVLTADTASSGGVKWATPATGGMTLLSTTNLSGTSTVISSINQGYTNLMVAIQNPYVNTGARLRIYPNGISGTSNGVYMQGGTVSAQSTLDMAANLPTTTNAAVNNMNWTIFNYADTTYGKPFLFFGTPSTTQTEIEVKGGTLGTASALTSFTVTTVGSTSTFSGGRVLVYGVK